MQSLLRSASLPLVVGRLRLRARHLDERPAERFLVEVLAVEEDASAAIGAAAISGGQGAA